MKTDTLTLAALALLLCACSNGRNDDYPTKSATTGSTEDAELQADIVSQEEANRRAAQQIDESNADAEYEKLVKELEGGD
jgi:uncharacterized lipoprotein YajG